MSTEQQLKDRCTPDDIKRMVELAEGFKIDKHFIKIGVDSALFEDILHDFNITVFSTLIHRAVDGWNKITRNKYIIITDTFLYTTSNLHQGDERYNYNNYQPQSLTHAECAMLHCMLDIFKEQQRQSWNDVKNIGDIF